MQVLNLHKILEKREYCCDLQMLLIHLTSGLDVLVMFEVMGQ